MPPEFNCAVCESLVEPNHFGLCNTCGWEEDILQEENPDYQGGANPDSLNERKAWWISQIKPKKPESPTYTPARAV